MPSFARGAIPSIGWVIAGDRVSVSELYDLHGRFDRWFTQLLPVWTGPAWNDRAGACAELVDAMLQPLPTPFHRATVAGRQMLVFSLSFRRWGHEAAAERAHQLLDGLQTRFWDSHCGGWFFSIDPDGQPLDRRKDLYALAFGLLGLATFASVFDDRSAIALATEADDALRRHMRHADGWFIPVAGEHWPPLETALRQNPHMHLFEAYVALYGATCDPRWKRQAGEIADLLAHTLAEPSTGAIREFFDGDGKPVPGARQIAEPGHHFEWYWLLGELERLAPDFRCPIDKEAMRRWAAQVGIDANGGVVASVDAGTGAVIDDRKRLWPMTELIKAQSCFARGRPGDVAARADLGASLRHMLDRHLQPVGWHEYLARDLSPIAGPLPSSSGYHLLLALLEVDRLLRPDG